MTQALQKKDQDLKEALQDQSETVRLNKKIANLAVAFKDSELAYHKLEMDHSTLQAEFGKQNSKNHNTIAGLEKTIKFMDEQAKSLQTYADQ